MKVLSIGTDRELFEEGSAVWARTVEYAKLFDELHIVVFSKRKHKIRNLKSETNSNIKIQITENCWVYSTNSWSRWFYVFNAIHLCRRIIRDSQFVICDSVITAQDPFECGFVSRRIAQRFKLPLHIQIHTDFLSPYFAQHSLLNRIRVRIARYVLSKASAIRVVSQRIKDSLRESRIMNHELKVDVLPVWSDVEKFRTTQPTLNLRDKYPQWDFIILMVTRLSPEKNVGFALRVFAELRKKYPKVGMVIVGSGSLQPSLRLDVTRYMLQGAVAFEGRQEDVVSYYKTADLFLQTSLYEGFGLALLEAVAAGCPAVTADVGIAPELLIASGRSFVCPVNNTDCFARTVSECIEDKSIRAFFAARITEAALSRFGRTKENYLAAYKASLQDALPDRIDKCEP